MATYILYGSKVSPAEAREVLERLLTVQVEARDSDYQNGEYFRAGNTSEEQFVLKRNLDPFDGEPAEMRFPEFPTLLYINATSRSEKLQKIFDFDRHGFALLRYEDFYGGFEKVQ